MPVETVFVPIEQVGRTRIQSGTLVKTKFGTGILVNKLEPDGTSKVETESGIATVRYEEIQGIFVARETPLGEQALTREKPVIADTLAVPESSIEVFKEREEKPLSRIKEENLFQATLLATPLTKEDIERFKPRTTEIFLKADPISFPRKQEFPLMQTVEFNRPFIDLKQPVRFEKTLSPPPTINPDIDIFGFKPAKIERQLKPEGITFEEFQFSKEKDIPLRFALEIPKGFASGIITAPAGVFRLGESILSSKNPYKTIFSLPSQLAESTRIAFQSPAGIGEFAGQLAFFEGAGRFAAFGRTKISTRGKTIKEEAFVAKEFPLVETAELKISTQAIETRFSRGKIEGSSVFIGKSKTEIISDNIFKDFSIGEAVTRAGGKEKRSIIASESMVISRPGDFIRGFEASINIEKGFLEPKVTSLRQARSISRPVITELGEPLRTATFGISLTERSGFIKRREPSLFGGFTDIKPRTADFDLFLPRQKKEKSDIVKVPDFMFREERPLKIFSKDIELQFKPQKERFQIFARETGKKQFSKLESDILGKAPRRGSLGLGLAQRSRQNQFERSLSRQFLNQRSNQKELFSFRQNQISKSMLKSVTIPRLGQRQREKTFERLGLISTPRLGRINIPKISTFMPSGKIPKMDRGLGENILGFGIRRKSRQQIAFSPSLTGIIGGFKAKKAPKGFLTGLEVRPEILNTRKRKKK